MAHDPLQYNARNTGLALNRLNAFPIDSSELWDKVGATGKLLWHDPAWGEDTSNDVEVNSPQELADKYADCSIAYSGQIISVVNPSDGLTYLFKIDDDGTGRKATLVSDGNGVPKIDIDSELSETSENPVQNKVITEALKGKITYSSEQGSAIVSESSGSDNFNCYGIKVNLTQYEDQFVDSEPKYLNQLSVSTRTGNYNGLVRDPLYAVILRVSNGNQSIVGYSNETNSFGVNQTFTFTFTNILISPGDALLIAFKQSKDDADPYVQYGARVTSNDKDDCGVISTSNLTGLNSSWVPIFNLSFSYKLNVSVSYTDQNGETRVLGEDDNIATHEYVKNSIENIETASTDYLLGNLRTISRVPDNPRFYYEISSENSTETIRLCEPYSIFIDWGDGSEIQHFYNKSTGDKVTDISHVYAQPGLYTCYFYGSVKDIGVRSSSSNPSGLTYILGDFSALNIEYVGFSPSMGRNWDHTGAFENCTNLLSAYLPTEATTIGNNCFKGCTSLRGISFFRHKQSAINQIKRHVFSGCSSLTSLNLNKTVITSIESETFDNSSLTRIQFPENFISISSNAFGPYSQNTTVSLYFDGVRDITNGVTIQSQPSNLTLNVYYVYGNGTTYKYNGTDTPITGYYFLNETDSALYNLIMQTREEMVTADDDLVTVSDS